MNQNRTLSTARHPSVAIGTVGPISELELNLWDGESAGYLEVNVCRIHKAYRGVGASICVRIECSVPTRLLKVECPRLTSPKS